MLRFTIDVLKALKTKGWTTYQIRATGLFNESSVQRMRHGLMVQSFDVLERICRILECQPGDIMEYVPDENAPELPHPIPRKKRTPKPKPIQQPAEETQTEDHPEDHPDK